MDKNITLSPNEVVSFLGKAPERFTLQDMLHFIEANRIRMIDFMYPAEDGRLKTLTFCVNSLQYAETVLSEGERVDGSSLFPSFVEAGSSDLYVIPRYRSAFVSPFAQIPTLCFLCSFFDKDGKPFDCSPERTLQKAEESFTRTTGMVFEAMGELEYYVIVPDEPLFPATDQRGYHESGPFAKLGEFRRRCMDCISRTGAQMKYGHSEVGNFTMDGKIYEQHEIEFLPCPAGSAADQLMLAKWIIRNLAHAEGLDVTFSPKIIEGEAGSGMHIHMRMTRGGRNEVLEDGGLSDIAKRAIAGLMTFAPSITAFGNKNPMSYFRLVPHQEAPTSVCWGDCNRSALVRVPLGWSTGADMLRVANPLEPASRKDTTMKQTFEMRSPDCSADIYELLAGLCVAAREGLDMDPGTALAIAGETYVDIDIHGEEGRRKYSSLRELPLSCEGSAACLEKDRHVYEDGGVFNPRLIDGILRSLRSYGDGDLKERAAKDPAIVKELVRKFFDA